jgi:ribose 5-phosphate isomerase B
MYMHVILGSDHGGFQLKEKVKIWLAGEGYEVTDVGAVTVDPEDDYVDFAKEAIKAAVTKEDKIILFCRNGFGMSIAANRFKGVRCGLAFDVEAVARGRRDDDINCLSIPADYFDEEKTRAMINTFLKEDFANEDKYVRRIMKIDNIN